MAAFIASLLITGVMVGIVLYAAKRRQPGQPLTWGEALLAGTFVLAVMLMIYGVVPDRWLRWADGDLKWRSDKVGIPTGPLPFHHHLLFEHGVYFFGRGRLLVTAEVLRDVIESLIYGVALVGNLLVWSWWQKRAQRRAAVPELETSAYGRPLVRKV